MPNGARKNSGIHHNWDRAYDSDYVLGGPYSGDILFSVVFYGVKGEKKMNERILRVMCGAAILLCVGCLAGCFSSDPPATNTIPITSPMLTPTIAPTMSSEENAHKLDQEYLTYVTTTLALIKPRVDAIGQYAAAENFEGVEHEAGMLRTIAGMRLMSIDHYQPSEKLNTSYVEFKYALQDFESAGDLCKCGARDRDADMLHQCARYIDSAGEHVGSMAGFLKNVS